MLAYHVVLTGPSVAASSQVHTLHELTQAVRETVLAYMKAQKEELSDAFTIDDFTFAAQAIQYDSLKPCYWQVLTYQCDVRNLLNEENDEQD